MSMTEYKVTFAHPDSERLLDVSVAGDDIKHATAYASEWFLMPDEVMVVESLTRGSRGTGATYNGA